MKKLIHICILSGLAALAASCWTEDIPEAGAARHQVEALTANLISVNRRYKAHAGVRLTDV